MEQQLEALKEASEYLVRIHNGIEIAIDCLREEELGKGYNLVGQIAQGVEWLYDVFKLTEEVQTEKINTEEFTPVWSDMVQAIENKDHLLLADLLEFEMLNIIQGWKNQLVTV